jgi:hypothetical protein
MLEGRYVMGLEQGDFTHFDQNGVIVFTVRYRDGAEIRFDGVRVPPPYQP